MNKSPLLFVYLLYTLIVTMLLVITSYMYTEGHPIDIKNVFIISLVLNLIFSVDLVIRFIQAMDK